MKTYLFLLIFLTGLLVLPTCLAYSPQAQNKDFELVISSNNATGCNLSYIQYPDGSKVITNLAMIQSGNTFYINVSKGNYTQLGTICHGLACTDSVNIETGDICREITSSGDSSNTSSGL